MLKDTSEEFRQNLSKKIGEAFYWVFYKKTAERIWKEVFTEEDRQRVGDFDRVFQSSGTTGLWRAAKGSENDIVALVDIARVFGYSDISLQPLINALDTQSHPKRQSRYVPQWDDQKCELKFDGEIICVFKFPNRAQNPITILNSFQEENWPDRIFNPLPPSIRGTSLKSRLRRLNDQTKRKIKFRPEKNGTWIAWCLTQK
jgi:hypothetical protein